MGALKTLTRRTFLIGSASIAGGVAFGVYTARTPHENPLARVATDGEAVFNPWVKVSRAGITLIAPHADVGQGVQHMQLTLIAEELDVDYNQFTAAFGQPDAAYYNTAMGAEMAPFRSQDSSIVAELARSAFGTLSKVVGLQGTGGSSSVPDSFDKLREAGAVARETLKQAAAVQTGEPIEQLRTERAAVITRGGKRLPYTELAELAATLEPVTRVALRPPETWRLIGKPTVRCDMVEKCTGTLTYGIDLQ
ncbi:MAG: xanthine dehydrogenase family protein molybdopterin-binding subunit, partial [Pseudomonadota bacterium]